MSTRRCIVLTVAFLMALGLTLPPAAVAAPARIELPRGWQPEGVTTDGRLLYVGSLANGALAKVNPRTGARSVLAPGRAGRTAVGVEYDRWHRLVWVAGGGTGLVRAHDARTGRVRAVYRFAGEGPRFINDLAVTRRGVFATDSANGELAVVPFRRGRLPRASAATVLPLTGDFTLVADEFNLNGIVSFRGRLLAVQSVTGLLFRINATTGHTRQVRMGTYRLVNGDGLERRGRTLYVVRNRDNLVAVLTLGLRGLRAERVAELFSRDFDVPTTVALRGRSLWAVNARFGDPEPSEARYWLTPLRAY